MPILLTNLNQKQHSKAKYLNVLEITEERYITRKEMEDKYKVVYGEFDDEGNWSCEIVFEDPLTYFCQVVFFSPLDTTEEKYRIRSERSNYFLKIFNLTYRIRPRRVVRRGTRYAYCWTES